MSEETEKENHERNMEQAIKNTMYGIIHECDDDPEILDDVYLTFHNELLKIRRDQAFKKLKKEQND